MPPLQATEKLIGLHEANVARHELPSPKKVSRRAKDLAIAHGKPDTPDKFGFRYSHLADRSDIPVATEWFQDPSTAEDKLQVSYRLVHHRVSNPETTTLQMRVSEILGDKTVDTIDQVAEFSPYSRATGRHPYVTLDPIPADRSRWDHDHFEVIPLEQTDPRYQDVIDTLDFIEQAALASASD